MSSPSDASDRRYRTTVPLVSRGLALAVALTSLPVFLVVVAFTLLEDDPLWVVALAGLLLFGPVPLLTRLRFTVELSGDELRYRVRPWHRNPRVVPLDSITRLERRSRRPDSRLTLRRINLGRGWVDWTDDEVRYVLGEEGVRLVRDEGRAVELWFPGAEELARALGESMGGTEGRWLGR